MSERKIGLGIVLAGFTALSAYAVYEHGVVGVFELALANSATTTAFVDLVIALSIVIGWMWRDATKRGTSPIPYVVLTLLAGSVGPLLYLLRRDTSEAARPIAARTARAS